MLFCLPDLGEGIARAEITSWLVSVGDEVHEDDLMVCVATDKTTVEIPAPCAGRVAGIHAPVGASVEVGAALIDLQSDALVPVESLPSPLAPAPLAPAPPPSAPLPPSPLPPAPRDGHVRAAPYVRRLAATLGVDLASVPGHRADGIVTEVDVTAFAAREDSPASPHSTPLLGARRSTAARLSASAAIPSVVVVDEVDLTRVDEAQQTTGVSHLSYLLRATVRALRRFADVNAHFDPTTLQTTVFDRVNAGIAVHTPHGLVVPVLRGCDRMTLTEIEDAMVALAKGAREGRLRPEQTHGASITFTSLGFQGPLFATPLLNPPGVVVVGFYRPVLRPVVVDNEVVVRNISYVTLTFDHRALDGTTASAFLRAVVGELRDVADGGPVVTDP